MHFALYKSVHGKHGACLIGYLCTSIFTPSIQVYKFHLWIIPYFTSVGVGGGGGGSPAVASLFSIAVTSPGDLVMINILLLYF